MFEGTFYAEARDVTEQRLTDGALQQSEARIRAILNSAVDAILTIDENGIIQSLNPATEELFGYTKEEMSGNNVSMLMPSPHSNRHDGYIRNYVETGVAKVIGIGRETVARRKDGSTFPIDLAVGEVQYADRRLFTGIVRDISDRKDALRRLEETFQDLERSRDDLLTTLNQLRAGTLIIDGDDCVAFASENWEAMTWDGAESAVGQRWDQVLPLDRSARERLRSVMRLDAPNRMRLNLSWQNAKGQTRAVEADIRDDPRDSAARILFIYDATELQKLRSQLEASTHGRMIGDCPPMLALYEQIAQVARGDWTVLIEGETGVGKELVARAVHAASSRQQGSFVAVNCAGLTDTLLESQLFGHRKGAFTGALADQRGLFEAAAGGTILLDEIGDISVKLQSTLLRVIQEREIMRVGDTQVRPVDVRIIAATNRDLKQEVAAGRFRQDLLYRIRVARIAIPPLRQRAADIPLLATSFLEEQRLSAGKPALRMDATAIRALSAYPWPGNVRELKSSIEYAVIHGAGSVIGLNDLPPEIRAAFRTVTRAPAPAPPSSQSAIPAATARAVQAQVPALPQQLPPVGDERDQIFAALEWAEGNRARAARRLGISRATLYRRLAEFGIPAKRERPSG